MKFFPLLQYIVIFFFHGSVSSPRFGIGEAFAQPINLGVVVALKLIPLRIYCRTDINLEPLRRAYLLTLYYQLITPNSELTLW